MGVEEVGGALLYEADWGRQTAQALADMNNSEHPPKDWEATKELLDAAGLPN